MYHQIVDVNPQEIVHSSDGSIFRRVSAQSLAHSHDFVIVCGQIGSAVEEKDCESPYIISQHHIIGNASSIYVQRICLSLCSCIYTGVLSLFCDWKPLSLKVIVTLCGGGNSTSVQLMLWDDHTCLARLLSKVYCLILGSYYKTATIKSFCSHSTYYCKPNDI